MDGSNTIVVGVSDAASTPAAIRYAVQLAALRDDHLTLAHAVPQVTRTGGLYAVAPDYVESNSRRTLAEAARLAMQTLDPAQVSTAFLHGSAVHSLVQVAQQGRIIVLGADARSSAERFASGSVVVGVATHSPVPSVIVPSAWSQESDVPQVTVGVRDVAVAADPVRAAFAAAAERHGRLVVLHVSGLPNPDEDPDRPDRHGDLPSLHLAELLAAQVAAVHTEYPDVDYETRIIHGPTAHVLTTATETSDLLVLERRWHPMHNPHLGRTARALLRTSRCPVLIAPAVQDPTSDASHRPATSGVQAASAEPD